MNAKRISAILVPSEARELSAKRARCRVGLNVVGFFDPADPAHPLLPRVGASYHVGLAGPEPGEDPEPFHGSWRLFDALSSALIWSGHCALGAVRAKDGPVADRLVRIEAGAMKELVITATTNAGVLALAAFTPAHLRRFGILVGPNIERGIADRLRAPSADPAMAAFSFAFDEALLQQIEGLERRRRTGNGHD